MSRIAAFVIWAAVAASMVFWAMRLWVKPIGVPAHATVVSMDSGLQGDLTRIFGQDAPPPSAPAAPQVQADARYRLIGVVAPRAAAASAEGLALIATDGKPARAYRVGTAVDGELVLLAVHSRGASLGPRGQPAQVALELPPLQAASTGTLPGAAAGGLMPRGALALPRPTQSPQALPAPPVSAAPDTDEGEPPTESAPPPARVPPSGAGRPPTVDRRPPA